MTYSPPNGIMSSLMYHFTQYGTFRAWESIKKKTQLEMMNTPTKECPFIIIVQYIPEPTLLTRSRQIQEISTSLAEVLSKFIKYHLYHMITIIYHGNSMRIMNSVWKPGNHITSSQTKFHCTEAGINHFSQSQAK